MIYRKDISSFTAFLLVLCALWSLLGFSALALTPTQPVTSRQTQTTKPQSTTTRPAVTTTVPLTAALSKAHIEQLVVDNAGLLTDAQVKALRKKLADISRRQFADVAVVTVESLNGKTVAEYADDYFDENGYGQGKQKEKDGILFLIAIHDREWAMSTCGFCIQAFTDTDLDYMENEFLPSLRSGDFANAFAVFANLCDEGLRQYHVNKNNPKNPNKDDTPYYPDTDWIPSYPSDWTYNGLSSGLTAGGKILTSLVIGSVISLIIVLIMRNRHKSVKRQSSALNCVVPGSVNIINAGEIFLGSSVARHARPEESNFSSGGGHSFGGGGSSTHTSSSGSTHGGSSGHF
ncbi:MAG: TPM domain-containing protein [Oscillospiraceae bacterium]|jgi:uncharacterized protein|nr:TPM domain-containing protein [Oscillospiraceae bacterium]